jgi:hypothetical protein
MVKEAIVIEEFCEEGSWSCIYDYDELPDKVKDKVDNALNEQHKEISCNIYEYGNQYLSSINQPKINIGEIVNFKGIVKFWHDE